MTERIKTISSAVPPAVACSAAAALMYFLVLRMSLFDTTHYNDYFDHANYATLIAGNNTRLGPHFLYEILLIVAAKLFFSPGAEYRATLLVVPLLSAFAVLTIYAYIGPAVSSNIRATLSLALVIANHIPLLYLVDKHMYFGYITANAFHNPTIVLLKPLAVLLFILSLRFLDNDDASWKMVAVAALVSVLAIMSKPAYTMCMIPALMLLLVPYRGTAKIGMIAAGLILPSITLLAWQYFQYFGYTEGGIAFKPFVASRALSDWLLTKLLLSLVFPLYVSIAFFHEIKSLTRFRLSWLQFLIGILCVYLLAESGKNLYARNFFWNAQITLFILLMVSASWLATRRRIVSDGNICLKTAAGWLLFVLHVAGGVALYATEYLTTRVYW